MPLKVVNEYDQVLFSFSVRGGIKINKTMPYSTFVNFQSEYRIFH